MLTRHFSFGLELTWSSLRLGRVGDIAPTLQARDCEQTP